MGDLWYLALAYGVIWVVVLAYLYSIARRQESLRQEVKAIEKALEGKPEAEEEVEEAEPFLTLVQGKGVSREGPARGRSAGEGRPGGC
jgi:CcmD family protein